MTRYQKLRDTLVGEISAGVFPIGSRFPTDLELCGRFGVSRNTVREAVRALQEEGLIVRQRGAGTVVRATGSAHVYSQRLATLAELNAYAAEARFEKHFDTIVVPRNELAELLDVSAGSKWLRIAGVRRLQGYEKPLAWTEIFISEPYISARDSLLPSEPYYEQLRRTFGVSVSSVEQRIIAGLVPDDISGLLQAEPGTPALITRRRYFAVGQDPIEVSLSLHPADRYAHTTYITRDHRRFDASRS
jgi:DNA-binding GntR family transcriptional regulator